MFPNEILINTIIAGSSGTDSNQNFLDKIIYYNSENTEISETEFFNLYPNGKYKSDEDYNIFKSFFPLK